MGEAKRKKQSMLAKPSAFDVPESTRAIMAEAMAKVLGAVTDFHGADCIMYTQVGVEILRQRGLEACLRAGTASWRVGSGDGDVVAHLENPGGALGAPAGVPQSAPFHAWIEVGEALIDLTTHALRDKARMLDAMDGGKTQVDWSPPFLWVHRKSVQSHRAVAMAPAEGAYSYERSERIERMVFAEMLVPEDVQYLAANVEIAITSLLAGNDIKVMGVGGAVPQDLDSARFMGQARGVIRSETPRS